MKLLFAIIILSVILMPIIFQIVFTVRKIKEKSTLSILMIFLWTLVLVIITSISATIISLSLIKYYNDSEQPSDINGIQFFIFFGILTALIIAPSIGLLGGFLQHLKNKNKKIRPDN